MSVPAATRPWRAGSGRGRLLWLRYSVAVQPSSGSGWAIRVDLPLITSGPWQGDQAAAGIHSLCQGGTLHSPHAVRSPTGLRSDLRPA